MAPLGHRTLIHQECLYNVVGYLRVQFVSAAMLSEMRGHLVKPRARFETAFVITIAGVFLFTWNLV